MSEFQVAYIPIGVPTFHLESAEKEFQNSIALLKQLSNQVVVPDEMLLSMDKLKDFLGKIQPDLIILQNITFANAAYASEVLHHFNSPIVLWTLREPVIDGGRLRLNSLTGAYSAANAIKAFRKEAFTYVFGSPKEEKVRKTLGAAIRAAEVKRKLKTLKIASVGHTPEGFGFGRALDLELLEKFGVTLESIEARELIDAARGYTDDEAKAFLEDAKKRTRGLEKIEEKNQIDFAKLYKAYVTYVKEKSIGALSSRCWPDFFTSFGTPVCMVLAILNDLGIAASCEADTYGALSMYIGMQLSGNPVFFGDPVSMDEKENTITYWHCGTAACTLARADTGAAAGVHCNRKIGPTLDFGCKSSPEVTVFRIGRKPDGTFRIFLMKGEALDKEKQFTGTSVVVKAEHSVEAVVKDSVRQGFEPHFCVIYGDAAEEIEILGEMLNLEIVKY